MSVLSQPTGAPARLASQDALCRVIDYHEKDTGPDCIWCGRSDRDRIRVEMQLFQGSLLCISGTSNQPSCFQSAVRTAAAANGNNGSA